MEVFQPEAIVVCGGADSLSGDRLGCFNLSLEGHSSCMEFLAKFGVPMLILGGGRVSLLGCRVSCITASHGSLPCAVFVLCQAWRAYAHPWRKVAQLVRRLGFLHYCNVWISALCCGFSLPNLAGLCASMEEVIIIKT